MRQRTEVVQSLVAERLDVLVIGGGIVGAGIARDAAMRGLRTGLVEQYDFAFGTSSRSSRLLHGGLRYLAQGKLGLVRQASIEKKILHHIAPHLAEPLAFVFPTFRGSEWPWWQLRIGVKVYDLLCGGRNLGDSSGLNPTQVLETVPGLTSDGLTGAVRYFDGLTNDARMVMDTLRSAANAGATVVNYVQFSEARPIADGWKCELFDRLTGIKTAVYAKNVVNATGPWADGLPNSQVKLRLTKGIHLVVDRRRLPVKDAVVMSQGRRILFVIPWGERTIIGTTDTDYRGSLEGVTANTGDVEYLLRLANQFFPAAGISSADVISTWAGLRPLIADPNGKPSDISRAHEIHNPRSGWWDVAGGKLTTYRLMAEETVDQIIQSPNASGSFGRVIDPCRTAEEPLLASHETAGVSGIVPPAFGRGPVEHYCDCEWAVNLDDVMVRRTSWQHYHADAEEKARLVAQWMAEIFGWTRQQREAQLNRYRLLVGGSASEDRAGLEATRQLHISGELEAPGVGLRTTA